MCCWCGGCVDCDACTVVLCEGDSNAGVGAGGGVDAVRLGCEYMSGPRDSGGVPSANDVLEMNVVRGMSVCVASLDSILLHLIDGKYDKSRLV